MKSQNYIYWQENAVWLGYLEEFPSYMTQGKTLNELKENLRDIYHDLDSGSIPSPRRVGKLQIA
ncbi:MAG: type II toxin-antitoxin system HicB family antitoxin [Kiritimatiellales bacterium]